MSGRQIDMSQKGQKQYLPIIEITNGYKHYGIKNHWRMILRKFNLKTYPKQIYVLLGPNGCGKSTVLNVILGLTKLNQGQVQIFGFKPGHELSGIPGCRVGYIPQRDGLHMNFSIHELLRYYGALLGLSSDYINDRMNFLTDLLNLPTEKIQIQFYTGNLRKQISIAIALLHEPEIIILDEPTAGVDPGLKANIWKYLKDLIKNDERTIVVTSGDALDALQGDRLGIIRNGTMIMEGYPKALLAKYKASNVTELYEKVYSMNLSFLDEKDSVQENPLIQIEPMGTKSSEGFMYTEILDDTVVHNQSQRNSAGFREKTIDMYRKIRLSLPNLRRLRSLMFCDLIFLIRSLVWLFMFLILPALFLMIYGLTINLDPSNIAVAIVNKESKQCSNDSEFISCKILDKLDSYTLTRNFFDDKEKAMQKIDKLEMDALIEIGEKFSEGIKDDSKAHAATEYVFKLHLDESNKITSDVVQTKVFNAFQAYFSKEYKSQQNPNAYQFPLRIGVSIFGDRRITINHYIVLGMIVVLTFHMMAFITAYNIVDNKEKKIYQRDYIAGVKLKEIIITRTVTYGLVVFIQTCLLFIVVMCILKLPYTGDKKYAFVATISIIFVIALQIWCGMVFGIFISTLFKQPVHALCCIACTMVVALTVEGIIWPEHVMPSWLRCIVFGLPHNRSAFTIRSLILRGTHMGNFVEWLGVIVPLCWIVVFTILFNVLKSY